MKNTIHTITWLTLVILTPFAFAGQDGADASSSSVPASSERDASGKNADGDAASPFAAVPVDAEKRLEESLQELARLRREKDPIHRRPPVVIARGL